MFDFVIIHLILPVFYGIMQETSSLTRIGDIFESEADEYEPPLSDFFSSIDLPILFYFPVDSSSSIAF